MPRTLERDPTQEADLFDRLVSPEPMTGCWLWLGSTDRDGYGVVRVYQGGQPVVTTAHRAMWQLRNGPFPPGKMACHHCDTPGCANPDHVWPGTQKENAADCIRKGRANFRPRDLTDRVAKRIRAPIADDAVRDPTFPIAEAWRLFRYAYKKRSEAWRIERFAVLLYERRDREACVGAGADLPKASA